MIDTHLRTTIVSSPLGRLDEAGGDTLLESIRGHVGRECGDHTIDLRGVEKIDATSARALIAINRLISGVGGTVRLIVSDPRAVRFIKLTKLDRVFHVHADLEAASAFGDVETRRTEIA